MADARESHGRGEPSEVVLGRHRFHTSRSLWMGTHSPQLTEFNVAAFTFCCKSSSKTKKVGFLGRTFSPARDDGENEQVVTRGFKRHSHHPGRVLSFLLQLRKERHRESKHLS